MAFKDLKSNFIAVFVILMYIIATNLFIHDSCIFKIVFGIPCPGCGMTRAFKFLLQGDINNAFLMHPLFALVIIFIPLFVWFRYVKRNDKIINGYLFVFGILCLILYIFRMIKYFPNTPPMDVRGNSIICHVFGVLKDILAKIF